MNILRGFDTYLEPAFDLLKIVDEIQETRYYVDSHGEVKRPQEIANWPSKMLIRSSLDDTDWWDTYEPDGGFNHGARKGLRAGRPTGFAQISAPGAQRKGR